MAITDNLVLKVQPVSGDTYVKNLVTVEDVAASGAGTITLVDDAGLKGWQIAGLRQGVFTGGVPYEANTVTLAVRFKANSRGADFLQYIGLVNNATLGSAVGPVIGNNGTSTGTLRMREAIAGSGFTVVGTSAYTTAQYITCVMRFQEGGASNGTLDLFLKQTSRANNNPDFSVVRTAAGSSTAGIMNNLFFGAAGTDITVVDMYAWTVGKTNAECAALADDIRTTINAVPASVNLAISNLSSAATLSTGAATVTPAVAGVTNLAISNLASASMLSTVAATVTPVQGTLTSDIFGAWGSQAALVGLTVPRTVVLKASDGSQVLNLANQVTNGAGRVVLASASLVAGTWYMMANWDPADPVNSRGFKAYQAT